MPWEPLSLRLFFLQKKHITRIKLNRERGLNKERAELTYFDFLYPTIRYNIPTIKGTNIGPGNPSLSSPNPIIEANNKGITIR